ncbi:MAG: hypothetical protein ACRBDI_06050 [Alphaproteobacteria bacterium]
MNKEENELILDAYPKDQFIRATSNYQLCLDYVEDIEEFLRPSLKKYMEGPFVLAIYNHGDDITKSMLIFEIQSQKEQKETSGIILDDPQNWTNMSLGVFPFVDLFRKEIDREAERSAKLLKAAKITNLKDVRARQNTDIARSMADTFLKNFHQESTGQDKLILGREAVSDTLASSLSAQTDFYSHLWDSMRDFFEPSFRHIGEQYALGNTNLESMASIIAPQSQEPE